MDTTNMGAERIVCVGLRVFDPFVTLSDAHDYKLDLWHTSVFDFLQMTLLLNNFAHLWYIQ